MAAATKFVRSVWKSMLANQGHDGQCLKNLEIVKVEPNSRGGKLKARLRIERNNLNRLLTLHGGLISTLIDTCGSLSISSKGFWVTGVSTEIHVCFLKSSGTTGDTIDIEAMVDSMGRTLAYTSVLIKHPETGKVLARGSHTKYIAKAFEHEKNVKFDEEGENLIEGTIPEEDVEL